MCPERPHKEHYAPVLRPFPYAVVAEPYDRYHKANENGQLDKRREDHAESHTETESPSLLAVVE
ncbi:MAG: hypothetical protein J6T30_06950 [Bacteroidales bacterium]|nr:hypothetical protein [Bacteroidales bacterium]